MQTRRDILAALMAAPFAAGPAFAQEPPRLALTPACPANAAATLAQTEGPYFTPDTPERRDLAADRPEGAPLTLGGYVLDPACRPQAGALIELWQADETGAYDLDGFALRGHQFADADRLWWFETIAPGLYPGRTRHFHVKVQPRGGRILTTQLYFPGEPGNARDRIFDPSLILAITQGADAPFARFDFVIA